MNQNKVNKEMERKKNEILKTGYFARVEIIVPKIEKDATQIEPFMKIESSKCNTIMHLAMYDLIKKMAEMYLEEYPEIKLASKFFSTDSIVRGSTAYEDKEETELDRFVKEATKKLTELIEKEEKEKKDE